MTRSLTAAVAACSLAAFMGGCSALSAQADATRYFVLTPSSASERKPIVGFDRSVGIGPVTVPDHLEDYLVTRLADQEIFISDTDRWGEPLHESLQHVLRQDLMTLLGTERIQLYPWGLSAPPDLAVALEVLHFQREVTGSAAVTVRWSIQRGSDRAPLLTEGDLDPRAHPGNDSRDAAAALSTALGMLSRQIAAEIRRVSAGAQAGR